MPNMQKFFVLFHTYDSRYNTSNDQGSIIPNFKRKIKRKARHVLINSEEQGFVICIFEKTSAPEVEREP